MIYLNYLCLYLEDKIIFQNNENTFFSYNNKNENTQLCRAIHSFEKPSNQMVSLIKFQVTITISNVSDGRDSL